MIPMMNIIAWSASAPWAEIRQVEQDLIISRALIELFGEATRQDGTHLDRRPPQPNHQPCAAYDRWIQRLPYGR
jgi:hypothetical protein